MHIDIWSDIACPFCYIGITQLKKALADFPHSDAVKIRHRSYQLDPTAPMQTTQTQAEVLADKKSMPLAQIEAMFSNVESSAAKEGLEIDFTKVVAVNTELGHRLIHFASEAGKADEAWTHMFKAYFSEGRDIADTETLLKIADDLGLDQAETLAALDSSKYKSLVQDDIKLASGLGIRGVPFFLINKEYALSGAQGEATFREALQKIWHQTPSLTPLGTDQAEACQDGLCLPRTM